MIMGKESYISDDFNRFGCSFDVILDVYERQFGMSHDETAKTLLTETEYQNWLDGKLILA